MASLIDRCATLRAAFAGNDPNSVSTLQAGGAATTRYLSQSVQLFEDQYCVTERMLTGMVMMPSISYMHGIANLSKEERRHIAVLFVEEESDVEVGREERMGS